MARLTFPDDRLAYGVATTTFGVAQINAFQAIAANTPIALYIDAAATTLADIQFADGTAVTTLNPLRVDAYSRIPLFLGPADGTDTLYAVINGGPASPVYARVDDRLDALTGLGSAEAAARAAADSAESSARAAADSAQTAQEATDTAARLKPRGAWLATTVYAVNDAVTANGVGWRCILAHTSGASFSADPTKWERFGIGQVLAPAPTSPATDDLWYDKANDLWKRWNGSAWVADGNGTYVAQAAPLANYGATPALSRLDLTGTILAANAADYLHSFVTYVGGQNSVVEPSVYYNPNGWNGFEFWLAAGPYENSNAAVENPSIWCSHDGQTWQIPPGATNPVQGPPGSGNYDDPHLFEYSGVLYLVWNWTLAGQPDRVLMSSSTDGKTWSAPVTVVAGVSTTTHELVSPHVEYLNGTWHMWALTLVGGAPFKVQHRTASTLTGTWSAAADCTLPAVSGKDWWEFEVRRVDGEWWMLILVNDTGQTAQNGQLYLATSTDGVTWSRTAAPVLSFNTAGWDYTIYKASFVPIRAGYQTKIGIWYSAKGSGSNAWHIGYTVATIRPPAGDDPSRDKLFAYNRVAPFVAGDSFARPDSASALGVLSSGQTWSAAAGTFGISSGKAYLPAATGSKVTVDSGTGDHRVRVEYAVLPSNQAWTVFRYQDANNFWRAGVSTPGSWYLQKVVAGAVTTVLSPGLPLAVAGDVLEVNAKGSTISMYVNGAILGSTTDSAFSTATLVGLQGQETSVRFGPFTVRSAV